LDEGMDECGSILKKTRYPKSIKTMDENVMPHSCCMQNIRVSRAEVLLQLHYKNKF
jgi:hypothetical protein